jgi:hypothetical protein
VISALEKLLDLEVLATCTSKLVLKFCGKCSSKNQEIQMSENSVPKFQNNVYKFDIKHAKVTLKILPLEVWLRHVSADKYSDYISDQQSRGYTCTSCW